MKKIKNKLVLLFISSMVLLGCDEDSFLTKANPNAYDASLFYQNEADFNSALTTVYGALQFQSISGKELITEMAQGDLTFASSFSAARQYHDLSYNDGQASIASKWNELYIGINRANQVLAYLVDADEAMFTTVDKSSIEGQARFLRAFYYFQLVSTYGQGVLRTELVSTAADSQQSLSTLREITDTVIIPDLEFAKENLPKTWETKGRVTSGAAASLLGKVYLYDKDWQNAATEFKEVIDSKVYSLTPDYKDNFEHYREFNEESILEVNYSFDLVEGANGNVVDDTPGGNTGAESSGLATAVGKSGLGGFNQILVGYQIHEILVADELADGSGGHSPRLNASIAPYNYEGEYYLESDGDLLPGGKWNIGITAYIKKYSNWYHLSSEPILNRSGINFRHIRYADVLLMYAEALLEGGTNEANVTEAITYIDMVRNRAKVITLEQYMANNAGKFPQLHVTQVGTTDPKPLVDATAVNVLTHLQRVERPVELAFEGHRWKDLTRWGIVEQIFEESQTYEENFIENYTQRAGIHFVRGGLQPARDLHFINPLLFYSPALNYWPVPNKERQNNDGI